MSLFGDYGSQAGSDTFMIKKNGGIPNDLARLRGSRLVATSEVEEGQRFAESSVKQMTGGDIVLARFLHNEYFEYLPAFKIWIAANHKPQIRDYAIWSRIHLIPFLVTIPEKEQDKELCNKLKSELSGILNWAIKGCLEWQRLGLNPPKEIKAETEKYRKEMNDFLTWLELRCETGGSYFSGATELYEDYKTWAEENVGWTMKQKKFGMKMSDYGFDRVPTPYIKYRGIKLRDLL